MIFQFVEENKKKEKGGKKSKKEKVAGVKSIISLLLARKPTKQIEIIRTKENIKNKLKGPSKLYIVSRICYFHPLVINPNSQIQCYDELYMNPDKENKLHI